MHQNKMVLWKHDYLCKYKIIILYGSQTRLTLGFFLRIKISEHSMQTDFYSM